MRMNLVPELMHQLLKFKYSDQSLLIFSSISNTIFCLFCDFGLYDLMIGVLPMQKKKKKLTKLIVLAEMKYQNLRKYISGFYARYQIGL